MESDEQHLKSQLIDTVKNIRQKYKDLNRKTSELNEALNVQYKPLLDPLNKLANSISNSNPVKEEKEEEEGNHRYTSKLNKNKSDNDDMLNSHNEYPKVSLKRIEFTELSDFLGTLNSNIHDYVYGIREKDDSYFIGNTEVSLNSDNILVCGESFPLTIGLMNLLFLKNPKYYLNSDLKYYKNIISLTNVHKRYNNPNERMKRHSRSKKFSEIIEPMFIKSGNSLQTNYMELIGNVDYKYWDDPNELVDRLRLLIASQSAGHTGHNNEIIAIIEELRESNEIY